MANRCGGRCTGGGSKGNNNSGSQQLL